MAMNFAPPLNAINAVGTEDPDSRVAPDFIAVNEARTGNVDAFEALVLRYQGKIVNYASAMTRDASDAEDVAQETFVRAYRSLHQFRGGGACVSDGCTDPSTDQRLRLLHLPCGGNRRRHPQ